MRKFKVLITLVFFLVSLSVFAQYSKKDKQYYPKASEDADIVLFLSSNVENTTFFIDDVEIVKGKRAYVLINKKPHEIAAHPEGYMRKESYLQPPYRDNQATLYFTFLIQDKVNYIANKNALNNTQSNSSPSETEVNNIDNGFNKTVQSDVDYGIPIVNGLKKDNTFALVIGNEDYKKYQTDLSSEVNVDFAVRDAQIFSQYLEKTLGIPNGNIFTLVNATSGQMKQSLAKLNVLAEKSEGKAELIFYYAGHGLPNEQTKEPFLIPVDVAGTNVEYGLKLTDVYKDLCEFSTQRVTVFLDACFSGGARNQGLVAARGVKIKPKENSLNGKLVVYSASSGEQSSLPYKDQGHGIFTYYLLKKLKDTNGNISYSELADYLKNEVGLKSVLINSKEQDPQVNVSPDALNDWENWYFNK
jgi:hypothetical protein